MTAPDELERAVERLNDDLRLNRPARLGTVAVSDRDLRALLSERAELLAAVERMRGALSNLIRMNEEHNAAVEKVMVNWSDDYLNEARAALTTGEATATEQGERG